MKICTKCKAELHDEDVFCENCGSPCESVQGSVQNEAKANPEQNAEVICESMEGKTQVQQSQPYVNANVTPIQPVVQSQVYLVNNVSSESYFDGSLASFVGKSILAFALTVLTLGLGFPWAVCMLYRWEIQHTIIDGRRLAFNGNGFQLFGNWIKWFLLTIITLGIYSFWLNINLKKWKAKHTHFIQ